MTDAEFEPVELEGGDDTSPTREPIGRRLALASHFSPTVARRDSFGAELGLHLQEAQPPSAQPQPTQPTPTQQQSAPPSPPPQQQQQPPPVAFSAVADLGPLGQPGGLYPAGADLWTRSSS